MDRKEPPPQTGRGSSMDDRGGHCGEVLGSPHLSL